MVDRGGNAITLDPPVWHDGLKQDVEKAEPVLDLQLGGVAFVALAAKSIVPRHGSPIRCTRRGLAANAASTSPWRWKANRPIVTNAMCATEE